MFVVLSCDTKPAVFVAMSSLENASENDYVSKAFSDLSRKLTPGCLPT
jgi:hypothetical protein